MIFQFNKDFMPHLQLMGLKLQISQELIGNLQRAAATDVSDALNDII
jgi:hypothetical protein